MMVGPVEAERRAPIVADDHDRGLRADHRIDESPEKSAMGRETVCLRTGMLQLVGIPHADQIRRDAAAEPGHFRHDIAPQV